MAKKKNVEKENEKADKDKGRQRRVREKDRYSERNVRYI